MNLSQDMQWWLGRYGRLGRFMHDLTIDSLHHAHDEHMNAQAQITADHRRVYGPINFTAQDFFHKGLKERPEVIFKQPRPGVPKLPIVNGRVVIFWRYANKDGVDVLAKKFGTSDARIAAFSMEVAARQEVLDFEVNESLPLTTDDRAFLEKLKAASSLEESACHPVTVMAYASNAAGLYQVLCADAQLNGDGTLKLTDVHLLSADRRQASQGRSVEFKRFDQAPRKSLPLKPKTGNE